MMKAQSAPLFQRLLGDDWARLPPAVRKIHSPGNAGAERRMAGLASVRRGSGWLVRLAATLVGFPEAGEELPVEVQMVPIDGGEQWRRNFGGRFFASSMAQGRGSHNRMLLERFGPLTFLLHLVPDGERLRFVIQGWRLAASASTSRSNTR